MDILRVSFESLPHILPDKALSKLQAFGFAHRLDKLGVSYKSPWLERPILDVRINPSQALVVCDALQNTDGAWEIIGPLCPSHQVGTYAKVTATPDKVWRCLLKGCSYEVLSAELLYNFLSFKDLLSMKGALVLRSSPSQVLPELGDGLWLQPVQHVPMPHVLPDPVRAMAHSLRGKVKVVDHSIHDEVRIKVEFSPEELAYCTKGTGGTWDSSPAIRALKYPTDEAKSKNDSTEPATKKELERAVLIMKDILDNYKRHVQDLRQKAAERERAINDLVNTNRYLAKELNEAKMGDEVNALMVAVQATDLLVRTVAGLNLQDHSLADQRAVRTALEAAMKALKNGGELK